MNNCGNKDTQTDREKGVIEQKEKQKDICKESKCGLKDDIMKGKRY